jgi:uncharacterized protein (UPF0276 family)
MKAPLPSLPLPLSAGIGLRAPHIREVQERLPVVGWLEVHAENYMTNGVASRALARLRNTYPLSLHGVGLSLGSAAGIDSAHLDRLAEACRRFQPAAVSEHLAWSSAGGAYLNDLLPVPFDEQALRTVAANVHRTQEALKRPILVENLSAYVSFACSTMSEPEFLIELVKRTGCSLLLDINNIYVSARNLGFDAHDYIDALPAAAIGEIHLAGHAANDTPDGTVLIDNHGSRVAHPVWALYARAIARFGRKPTLIEWDSELPPLATLLGEAMWADMLANAVAGDAPRSRPAPGRAALTPANTAKPAAAEFSHA